jgi:hypothetical protein
MPVQPPLRWKLPLACALSGALAFGASQALARAPGLAESAFARGVSPLVIRPISLGTGLVPVSVAELAIAAYAIWILVALARGTRAIARPPRSGARSAASDESPAKADEANAEGAGTHRGRLARATDTSALRGRLGRAAANGALRILRDVGLAIFLLYAMWGFNYARPPLETRLGWPAFERGELSEVVRLAEAAVSTTNRAYLEIHGSNDSGTPTPQPRLAELQPSLDRGWQRLTEHLDLQPSAARRYGRVKQPLTTLLEHLEIFGVFVPWTAEATVARDLPAVRLANSMAHEMAHQRGVAIEAEADFLAFLACSLSGDPLARYAAASANASDLIAALPRAERRRVAGLLLPGVVRDLRDLDAYGKKYESAVGEVQTRVNDRYLRANRVPGGVENYGRSVRLLITYFREHPEGLDPGGVFGGE